MSLEKNTERIAIALEKMIKLTQTTGMNAQDDAGLSEGEKVPPQECYESMTGISTSKLKLPPKSPVNKKSPKKKPEKEAAVFDANLSEVEKPTYDEDALRSLGKNIHLKYPNGVGMKKVHGVLLENGAPTHKIFELKPEVYTKVGQALENILGER